MFKLFSSLFGSSDSGEQADERQQSERDRHCNGGLQAYVVCFPAPDRLTAYIEKHCPEELRAEVEAEVQAVIRSADAFLYGQTSPVQWGPAFKRHYFSAVSTKHPWLTKKSGETLNSYAEWLCMREGMDR
jgi:hypothetical protein